MSTRATDALAQDSRVAVSLQGSSCLAPGALDEAVTARGAHVDPAAPVRLNVRVLAQDEGGAVHVDVTGENERGPLAERSLDAGSCAEALDAVALLVALAAEEPPPPPPAPRPSSPVVASFVQTRQPAETSTAAAPSAPTPHRLEASATLAGTSLGGGQIGARVSVGNRWQRTWLPWVEVGLGATLPSSVQGGGGQASLGWMTGRVTAAPIGLELDRRTLFSLYGGMEAGALHVSGEGTSRVDARTRPWLAALAGARLSWDAADGLFAGLSGGAVVPFARDSFVFVNGGTAYQVPAVAAEAGIFVGAHFP